MTLHAEHSEKDDNMQWRVQVLGGLALVQGEQVITRFESNKVALLLAYLALNARRAHPREELLELLWPDADPNQSRPRLRQALYSLRHQLEPPGIPAGSVLLADRQTVRLNPEAFTCDTVEFEQFVRQGRIEEARLLYTGDLLPGYYEDWTLRERDRLAEMYASLPQSLSNLPAVSESANALAPPIQASEFRTDGNPNRVSLPGYLTPFLGRDEEQRQLLEMLAAHRLVTITGLGGMGKTRLAVAAARLAAANCEIVAFVPLADCASPMQAPELIRSALNLPVSSASTFDQIATVLADRKAILILDNFEQLVAEGGANMVETLLLRLPALTCLVTSRRLLGIAGEQELPLTPFPAAPPDAPLAEIAHKPGVALFVQRAQAARPGFQITEHNRADIAALCAALENIPLALELAASRIRALSPAEMREQIEARFAWLSRAGAGGDKEARQRSLAGALEWSWRLLSPSQARFLAALSVFRGGWTAAIASAVCEAADARERLEDLIMDSLVFSEQTPEGTTRFQMLETVRAFARERLSGEEAAALQRRHLAAFLALAQQSKGSDTALQPESGNLQAALQSAMESKDANAVFALCLAVDEGWMTLTGAQEALSLMMRALRLSECEQGLLLRTMNLAAYLAITAGDMAQAASLAADAVGLAQFPNAERAVALAMRAKVGLMLAEPLDAVGGWLEEAQRLAANAGDTRTHASTLRLMGIRAARLREFQTAETHFAAALELSQAAGDRQGVIYALARQAVAAMQQGDLERALELNTQCQQQAAEAGDMVYEAEMYQNLACIYAAQTRWQDSLDAGRECLRRNQLLGNTYILALSLWNLTEPLARLDRETAAIQLLGFAARFWTEHYAPFTDNDTAFCRMIRERAEAILGVTQTAELWQSGERLTLPQAISLALSD